MKKLITVITVTILLFAAGKAQSQNISFAYDKGGNIVKRSVQVFALGRLSNPSFTKDSIVAKQLNFSVFPNPTNDFIMIEGQLPETIDNAAISITNVSGQVLKTDVYTGQSKKIPVSDLKTGMYILEIKYSKKEKSTYKIIITN